MWIQYRDGTRLSQFNRFELNKVSEINDRYQIVGFIYGEPLAAVIFNGSFDDCQTELDSITKAIADGEKLWIVA